ncbi:hypothetical protein HNR12_004184 [Streptomonospora nanhaiensis]|uniref:DUF5709 domain-containing protein n=1 Tax=Streptomonospora nanhaiensis TaxID=1323731 RepID=A0A853BTR8_9ACTN|nr:hypothetical protein [Streptomonospora nanhaiensis]NYI97907.1 hypothetical protein [Streptomonospora nanhaiensis]
MTEPQDTAPKDDDERSLETTDADFSEQHAEIAPGEDDWTRRAALASDPEVSEADAVEQLREVELDEDEYR